MIGLSDLRYDTSQVDGTFYDTYANAVSLVGGLRVAGATLALDSGWRQDSEGNYLDQKVNLTGAEVNGTQFTPLTDDPTTTCNLPPATINVTKLPSDPAADPLSVQHRFSDIFFRTTNDCTYVYNLDTASLLGPGDYTVSIVIDFHQVPNAATFKLR